MIAEVRVWEIRCDGCGRVHEVEDAPERFDEEVQAASHALSSVVPYFDWTTDSAGKHHCPECPKLVQLPAALDDLARRPGPNDVPLDFGSTALEVRS